MDKNQRSEDVQFPKNFGELPQTENIRKEIKDLDNWALHKVARKQAVVHREKHTPEQLLEKLLREARPCALPELDLQLIDALLRNPPAKPAQQEIKVEDATGTPSKKIAITSEMINRENNRTLMLGLIKKKIMEMPSFREFSEKYLYLMAKTILVDFVSSFHVLEVFKHQNVLHLRSLLAGAKAPVREAVGLSGTLAGPVPITRFRGFVTYERVLLAAHENVSKKIREKKVEMEAESSRIHSLRAQVESRSEALTTLVREMEYREGQSVFMRKFGQSIGIQESMAINELKKRVETEEAALEDMRKQISTSRQQSQGHAGQLTEEIRILRVQKTVFGVKLREFYLSVIRDEEDLLHLDLGLVEVLSRLLRFTEELKPSFFSSVFSSADVAFAFLHAKLLKQAAEVKQDNRGNQAVLKRLHGGLLERLVHQSEATNTESLQTAIQHLKGNNRRVFERKIIMRSKSMVIKWETCRLTDAKPSLAVPSQNDAPNVTQQGRVVDENFGMLCLVNSRRLNQISQEMRQARAKYLKEAFERLGLRRAGEAPGNSPELKKLLTLMFGSREAQATLNRFKELGWKAFDCAAAGEPEAHPPH